MRRCAIAVALAVALPGPAAGGDYDWPVVRVIDGDTVQVDAGADMPPELASLAVRLRGVDTPETGKPKCESERRAGEAATAFTKVSLAKAGSALVRNPSWGKFGGRVVANIVLDGETLSAMLIAAGHGRPHSRGRRRGWCR